MNQRGKNLIFFKIKEPCFKKKSENQATRDSLHGLIGMLSTSFDLSHRYGKSPLTKVLAIAYPIKEASFTEVDLCSDGIKKII